MNKSEILSLLNIDEFYRIHLSGITGQGNQRKALCPFHEDKTASLSVDFETGLFNCFACGEKGSAIDFVMKLKGLGFKEALTYLADRAGLPHSPKEIRSAAKAGTTPRTPQKAPQHQTGQPGQAHTFTLDTIKQRIIPGGYRFTRLHVYDSAKPVYIKAIYRNADGDKQGRFYSLSDPGKGLYIDTRTAAPVWFQQGQLDSRKNEPVFLPEGERDSLSLSALGLLSVTEGGSNDKITDEMKQSMKGRVVYVLCDNDAAGLKRGAKVIDRLKDVTAAISILNLPGLPVKGDISDWIEHRRQEGRTNQEISRQLQDLIEEPEAAAGPWLPLPEAWPYFVNEAGNLCRTYERKEGNTKVSIPITLCNFDAAITQEIIEDDGSEDLKRLFVIEGRKGNTKLHPLEVLHSKYDALSWHRQWGAQTVIEPGVRAKDLVRHAIETRSMARTTRRTYTHTGFREIGGKKVYLTGAGAIGLEGIEVRLSGELKRYNVPLLPENETEAIKASLEFLDIGRHEVTFPLWLMAYIAPLTSTLMFMFSGYLYGERDSMKTTLATLALSHFGDFIDKVGLLNFGSSSGSLEKTTSLLKDVLSVIDDFYPSTSKYDAEKMQKIVQDVIRGAGNRTGRGRLNADTSQKQTSYAKGMVLITAEKLPAVQSTRTRTLTIEIKRGDINLERLTALQNKASLLPHAMSSFIHWLRVNLDGIEKDKRRHIEQLRTIASKESSHKLAEHITYLQYAASIVCNWLVDRQAIDQDQAAAISAEAWQILKTISREHKQLIEEEDPGTRFIESLQSLTFQGKVRIVNKYMPEKVEYGNINGEPIGYCDGEWLFLHPEPLMQAIRIRYRQIGSDFPIDDTSLFKMLKNRHITKTDPDRATKKVRLPNDEGFKRVLQIREDAIFSQEPGTEGTEEDNEE